MNSQYQHNFTRADLDRVVKAMKEQRDALWMLESERMREVRKPDTPIQFVTESQFERIKKLTGARAERFTDMTGAKFRLAFGGVEFWTFNWEVA